MKNFLEPEDALIAFNGVGESSLERDKELYHLTSEMTYHHLHHRHILFVKANPPDTGGLTQGS